ncbi:MAG: glycosyltransferase family 1 protein [Candidatus Abyssobacteria bacterium SURF_17]|uniref:Glycosyltransferase family 1 protein n=1 Tax=Candidatus Abyssobacteria bacterium SURF_17 TaxID=2093361 RepID=A0A419EN15_9BACT|nr:MAG: glycosyltransferase family 1 protein [Candidatus Abyssubacteria bacterium SURF_17]
MRIGIDATPVTNRSGTGYYTQKLAEFLGRADSENEYFLFCPSDYEDYLEHPRMFEYPNFRILRVRVRGQASQFLWKQLTLPREIEKLGIDVFHFPSFIASLRIQVPSVVTVHDLCFELFPEAFSPVRRPYYRLVIPRSIRYCTAIIADSHATRADIESRLGVDNGRIQAIHLGVDPVRFYHVSEESEQARVRARYSLPREFILYVGTLEPRKNIPRLIRAFAYGVVARGLPHHLVIAGRRGWLFDDIFREVRALELSEKVCITGFVERSDLPVLYSMARVFAYPSLYEGFGLPCLEAMSCGTPVITSDRSSLPEIVGDDALTIDPTSVESIANALRLVCSDDACHKRLSECGHRRASRFSWLTTAKRTLEVYKKALREA